MNYVAHLFLAKPTDEHRIGSLLADFGVGPISLVRANYSEQIAEGVYQHRQIDRFTDTHEDVIACVDALNDQFGLYAGIVVDVVFDHFLLKHWDQFTPVTQDAFFDDIYTSLARTDWSYPPRYQRTVKRMLKRRWLSTYRELPNVDYALARIGERFSRPTPLTRTLPALEQNYRLLNDRFVSFFTQLIPFAAITGGP